MLVVLLILRMILKTKIRRSFTLLEIVLCIAILSLVSGTLGWQIRDMLGSHRFHKSVDHILTDLRKLQIIALSDREDIEIKLALRDGLYSYTITSDGKIPCLLPLEGKLPGVKQIRIDGKKIMEKRIQIYSTGRITPDKTLVFSSGDSGKRPLAIDLSSPLRTCKPQQRNIY